MTAFRSPAVLIEPLPNSHWLATPHPSPVAATIGAALVEASTRWPQELALVEGRAHQGRPGRTWTYAELADSARLVAQALLSSFKPGERVAVWATNQPEWLLLQFGAALAGLTLVTVNPAYGHGEVRYVLAQSRVNGLFVEPSVRGRDLLAIAELVANELPDLRSVVALDNWDQFINSASSARPLPVVEPRQPAQIQYTSGTTGFPKGAMLAHDGLALNAQLYAETIGARPGDVWVNPMPLFHTAGCGLATLGALQSGGVHVLVPGFDADVVLDLFELHRGTIMLCVPTMLIRVLDAQKARPRDVGAWRMTTLGGAPVPVELVRQAEQELGVTVSIGYGQTESSPYITHTLPNDPNPNWFNTIGRPMAGIEVKIAGLDGAVAALGQTGEICTRSLCLMLGYFDNDEATAQAIDGNGWLHTGDLGVMDKHGYLQIRGRMKELIIRGGENIYPREIEDVLYEHPGVLGVAVVGLPDDEWGEMVAAFVQVRSSHDVTTNDLEAYCRDRLASYKVPRIWQFRDELPQTASGKIQKFALRDSYLATGSASADTTS